MKIVAYIVLALLGLWVVGMLFGIISIPFRTAERQLDIVRDAQNQVLNADNAIYNYEWFKQKYQDIEVAEKQYESAVLAHADFRDSLPESRLDWTFEDKEEDSRLASVKLGLKNHLDSLIGDYNARASMATRNIFEESVLPSYIDALTFIGK